MGALQPWHLIVVLVIVLVIFGAGRLGEVGGALGKGIREFKVATKDEPLGDGDVKSTPLLPVDKKCQSCGTVNPPSQSFCGQCGTRLTVAA